MTDIQIITRDGEPEYAVVPYDKYMKLLEAAELAEDEQLLKEGLADTSEAFPASVVDRLLNGENPVKVWREYRGKNQTELAAACDVSVAYISKIESGQRDGSRVLDKIADALNISMDLLRKQQD